MYLDDNVNIECQNQEKCINFLHPQKKYASLGGEQ